VATGSPDFPSQEPIPELGDEQTPPQVPVDKLMDFGRSLAKKRDEWIRARRSQGIDKRWTDDLDQYHMKDNANRAASQMMEAVEQGFPVMQGHSRPTRSTIFIGLTRQKSNAAEARLADILLPTDDRNWGIQPTPVPELVSALGNSATMQSPHTGEPLTHPQTGAPMQVKEVAAQVHQEAAQKAEAMQLVIDEQLNISDYNGELRKMIHDAVVLGTGVMKGPIVTNRTRRAWRQGQDQQGQPFYEMIFKEELSPASTHKDPRNIFTDPSGGDDPHDGEGLFERDIMTGKQVRMLAKQPGYNLEQLRQVLREGPRRSATFERPQEGPDKDRDVSYLNKNFEVWEYWGEVDREDAAAAGVDVDVDDELESISACVIMINDSVVKAFLNPLDNGDLPYDFYQWEKVTGSVWGYGVPYLMRAQQKVINSSWRQLMDNLGITAGPQIVVKRRQITPADQSWDLTSRKIWYANDDVADVRQAFTAIEFESHADELIKVIEFAMKLVDEETAVPMLAQGEKGTAPDTVGGMQMLLNSSNVVLRRLVKQFDDDITRPHIRRYYDYNMLYNPKNEIKGDFSIDARGSSALLVRDIQNQAFLSLMQAGANPTYGIFLDLRKLFEKALQAQHIDPADIMASDAEIQQRQQAQQQAAAQQQNPAVQVAQVKAQSEAQRTQANAQSDQLESQTKLQMAHLDYAARLEELQAQKEVQMLTMANKQNMSLAQIRADLAATVINTNTQKELAAAKHHLDAQSLLANPSPDASKPGPYDQTSAPTPPQGA
jgi:hypothetical protein